METKPLKTELMQALDNSTDGSRASPDSHCVICLGQMHNKSFTDSCLHQFCYRCLLKWSRVKAECPLCKQPFKTIIHNVRSNDDYDQYDVPQEPSVVLTNIMSYRFMVDVFNTAHVGSGEYFHGFSHMLDSSTHHDQLPSMEVSISGNLLPRRPRTRDRTSAFRASIYRRNLWVRPIADFSGRIRQCNMQFYQDNPAQLSRLAPWVQRESEALFLHSASGAFTLYHRVMTGLRSVDMLSPDFRGMLAPLIEEYTDHFIHELLTFARSVYDMNGFDEVADYSPRLRRCRPPATTDLPRPVQCQTCDPDSDVEVVSVHGITASSVATVNLSETPIVIVDSDSDVVEVCESPRPIPEVLVISSDDEPQPSTSSGRVCSLPVSIMRVYHSSSSDDDIPLGQSARSTVIRNSKDTKPSKCHQSGRSTSLISSENKHNHATDQMDDQPCNNPEGGFMVVSPGKVRQRTTSSSLPSFNSCPKSNEQPLIDCSCSPSAPDRENDLAITSPAHGHKSCTPVLSRSRRRMSGRPLMDSHRSPSSPERQRVLEFSPPDTDCKSSTPVLSHPRRNFRIDARAPSDFHHSPSSAERQRAFETPASDTNRKSNTPVLSRSRRNYRIGSRRLIDFRSSPSTPERPREFEMSSPDTDHRSNTPVPIVFHSRCSRTSSQSPAREESLTIRTPDVVIHYSNSDAIGSSGKTRRRADSRSKENASLPLKKRLLATTSESSGSKRRKHKKKKKRRSSSSSNEPKRKRRERRRDRVATDTDSGSGSDYQVLANIALRAKIKARKSLNETK